MTPAVDVHRYHDATELAGALSQELAKQLQAALLARGRASLVVSGGRTPALLFQHLRQVPLAWEKVSITLADERWVDAGDPASNENMLRHELLRDAAARATFLPLKNAASSAQAGAAAAWAPIAPLCPFDVVILGMGDDGHTASLFPGSPGLVAAMDTQAEPGCVAMTAPVEPRERLSLNLAALLNARCLYVHFTGEAKWRLWQVAGNLPIGLTLRRSASRPQLYWSP